MENETPLTIDGRATGELIRKDGRTVTAYARLRGFAEGTVSRIVGGRHPHTDRLDTEYQKVLRQLAKDGYLVQAKADQAHSAAA